MHLQPFAITSSSYKALNSFIKSLTFYGVLAYRFTPNSNLKQLVRQRTVNLR